MNFDPNAILAPQEAKAAQAEADSVLAVVNAYEIDSPQMFEAAGAELQSIRQRHHAIEKQRVHIKEPFLEGCRRIDAFFKVPLDRFTSAADMLKDRMLAFQTAERERQDAIRREAEQRAADERREQERIKREAEETARKAMETAQATKDAYQRQIAITEAEAAQERAEVAQAQIELADVAPVALPSVAAPKAAGIAMRETWKAEVIDLPALVTAAAAGIAKGDTTMLGFLQADTKALGQVATALKSQARIPGVRIYRKESLSVRAA